MELLNIENVSMYFPGKAGFKIHVLEDVSFTINVNEPKGITSLLAPEGAGKSTLLKIISALIKPVAGKVLLEGKEYFKAAGKIVLIPEEPSSYPWLNVKQNIELGFLKRKKADKAEFSNILSFVGLDGYEDFHPQNNSIGFRFRISLARALASNPKIILIDEPFKKLEHTTKLEVFTLIKDAAKEFDVKLIYATTNITEAIDISQEILLMKKEPGFVFHKIDVRKTKEKARDEGELLRNEIESLFKAKNILHNINFSI